MRRSATVAASVLDQAASSLTNILVLVIVARVSTAAGFAAFSMVYVTFTVLLGLNMSYVGQVVVLEKGGERALAAACRSATAFTALASLLAGALLVAGGAAVGGTSGTAFAALGAVLPLALLQDGVRYSFSALRVPHRALAADTLRLVCVVPALALQPHHASPARMVLAWGLSALPALLLALALLRPYVRDTRARLSTYLGRGHLGRRFVVEFAVGNASSQLAVLGLGLFANPLAVGALRGATTLFGPLNVLFTSVNAFGPPVLGRFGGRRATARAAALLGLVLGCVALGWALLLYALPASAGQHLLGATWEATAKLLPATGAQYAVMALGTCALVTLRVLSPRATLSLQVVFSLLSVAFMLGGYALMGVQGAAWGLALGSALKALGAWNRVRGLPEHPPAAAPDPDDRQETAPA
ncbi:hypothetical protein [Streptomyces sp. NRRL F-5630]|uniref:hypothetical protein n=1 Tax=Streptomyces sp. NRRL F-5630 TaxID=1463864 RepID=UPI003D70AB72